MDYGYPYPKCDKTDVPGDGELKDIASPLVKEVHDLLHKPDTKITHDKFLNEVSESLYGPGSAEMTLINHKRNIDAFFDGNMHLRMARDVKAPPKGLVLDDSYIPYAYQMDEYRPDGTRERTEFGNTKSVYFDEKERAIEESFHGDHYSKDITVYMDPASGKMLACHLE